MVFLILGSVLAVLLTSWAGTAGVGSVGTLDRLVNAGGLLNRFLAAVEAVRDLALWLSPVFGQGQGRGPLSGARPAPSKPVPRPAGNPAAPGTSGSPGSSGTLVTDLTEFEGAPA